MTRHELDKLLSIQLDLERALWLLRQMRDDALAEHADEDAHHTALEQRDRSGQCKTPSSGTE